MNQTLVGLIAVIAPIVLGTWIGKSIQGGATSAFLAGYIATPLASFCVALVVVLLSPFFWPIPNIGTLLIALPTLGIGTGLVSGVLAALIVRQRGGKTTKPTVNAAPTDSNPR